ncbi:MAG: type III pantothenate kinase [Planctomycetaceae bacterium]
MSAVVAIDIGNTRAKFGIFQPNATGFVEPHGIVARVLSQTNDLSIDFLRWWNSLDVAAVTRVVVAGSDPDLRDELIRRWPLKQHVPLVVSSFQQIPVRVDVDFPARVGIDRLLNALAVARLRESGRPAIVVDSGTATTVDLVTSDGAFRGGSILPGLRLSAHAMHDYTARLPLVDVDETLTALPSLPGRNTEAAMLAGLFIGQLGAVREISERLAEAARRDFHETQSAQLFITGGGGRQLADHLADSAYVDSLALHGLALLGI